MVCLLHNLNSKAEEEVFWKGILNFCARPPDLAPAISPVAESRVPDLNRQMRVGAEAERKHSQTIGCKDFKSLITHCVAGKLTLVGLLAPAGTEWPGTINHTRNRVWCVFWGGDLRALRPCSRSRSA